MVAFGHRVWVDPERSAEPPMSSERLSVIADKTVLEDVRVASAGSEGVKVGNKSLRFEGNLWF